MYNLLSTCSGGVLPRGQIKVGGTLRKALYAFFIFYFLWQKMIFNSKKNDTIQTSPNKTRKKQKPYICYFSNEVASSLMQLTLMQWTFFFSFFFSFVFNWILWAFPKMHEWKKHSGMETNSIQINHSLKRMESKKGEILNDNYFDRILCFNPSLSSFMFFVQWRKTQ